MSDKSSRVIGTVISLKSKLQNMKFEMCEDSIQADSFWALLLKSGGYSRALIQWWRKWSPHLIRFVKFGSGLPQNSLQFVKPATKFLKLQLFIYSSKGWTRVNNIYISPWPVRIYTECNYFSKSSRTETGQQCMLYLCLLWGGMEKYTSEISHLVI